MPPRVQVTSFELRQSPCQTRLPFRFGAVTMTRAPQLCLRVELASERRQAIGYAADLLVPRWFDKDPTKTIDDNQRDLIAAAQQAAQTALACPPATIAELVAAVSDRCFAGTTAQAPERLRLGFGVALLERAAIDALCRSAGVSFLQALRADLFGLGAEVIATLPAQPPRRIAVRHTVGMQDPLTDADAPGPAPDELPRTLAADIASYGLRYFKLKIGAGRSQDLARLRAIAGTLATHAPRDWRCSLDGNEQYLDLAELSGLLRDLRQDALGRDLLARLLHIEQPLPRHITFAPDTAPALAEVAAIAPVIIDEADVDDGAFAAAHALGYAGVSIKNCKGVLRAVRNHARCVALRASGRAAFVSAEDLTNLPVLPLQQDLATIQALGLGHAERNGHHYFRGLDHLSAREAASAAAAHQDLYRQLDHGFALRIEAGHLTLGSLDCAGYGYASEIDFAARTPA